MVSTPTGHSDMCKLIQFVLMLCLAASCVTPKRNSKVGALKCQSDAAETDIVHAYAKAVGTWSFVNVKTTGWTVGTLKIPYKTKLMIDDNRIVTVLEKDKKIASFRLKLFKYSNSNIIRFELLDKTGVIKFYLPEEGVFFVCEDVSTFGDSEVDGVDYTISKVR